MKLQARKIRNNREKTPVYMVFPDGTFLDAFGKPNHFESRVLFQTKNAAQEFAHEHGYDVEL